MERRQFIQTVGAVSAAVAAGALPATAKVRVGLQHPLTSTQLLSNSTRQVGDWTEHRASIELVGANNAREVVDVLRRTNKNSRITTLVSSLYENAGDVAPVSVSTKTLFVELGEIGPDGKQEIEVVTIGEHGVGAPRTGRVKQGGQSPILGLTNPQEIVDAMFVSKGLK
jgi:hypothetical protein